jgi:hypothetical protein
VLTTNFYQTDKAFIVSETKRIFDVDICPTCSGQLMKAYQNLKTYYKNEMAKKKNDIVEVETTFKLKKEFEGSTYSNGKISILLSDLNEESAKLLLTEKEIKQYFE